MADKLPVWAAWLFTTPWWVPGLLALALTAWMMWITRPTARVLDGPTGAVPQSPGVDLLEAQARLTHETRLAVKGARPVPAQSTPPSSDETLNDKDSNLKGIAEIVGMVHMKNPSTDYTRNEFEFSFRVIPNTRLTHLKTYVKFASMRSGWDDKDIYWEEEGEYFPMQEALLLRKDEHIDVLIGSRVGNVDAPLRLLTHVFERHNNIWPYARVDVKVVAEEGTITKSFGILAPGYVFNTVVDIDKLPMSKLNFSKLSQYP